MPDHPDKLAALIRKAMASEQRGDLSGAVGFYRKALKLRGDFVEARNNLGNVLKNMGRLKEATAEFNRALKTAPGNPVLLNNLGNVLQLRGESEKALKILQKLVISEPEHSDAYNNLGNALVDLGRVDEGLAAFLRSYEINPNNAEINNNLGATFHRMGKLNETKQYLHQALNFDPNFADALNNLASLMIDIKEYAAAREIVDRALQLAPDSAYTHVLDGAILEHNDQLEEAIVELKRAIRLDRRYRNAYGGLGTIYCKQQRFEEGLKFFKQALEIDSRYDSIVNDYLFSLNYIPTKDARSIYREHKRLMSRCRCSTEKITEYPSPNREDKLRVGYVSPDYRKHSVAYFFQALLRSYNHDQFEVYCYFNDTSSDGVTEKIRERSDHWCQISNMSDKEIIDKIREDGIDILVDLAGHTDGNRLSVFACKPAPIQVTWLGYPATTGLPEIDYRITDRLADPVGDADELHTEKLVRLSGGFLCYQGDASIEASMEPPCADNGYVTFGSFNNSAKINAETVDAWAKIMHAVPGSRLLLKSKQLGDRGAKEQLLNLFGNKDIASDRQEIYAWLPSIEDHLKLYRQVDICLDTFPYNGTTTTAEALWMGVPVISVVGDRHAARVGASILSHVGLERLLALDVDEYVALAVKLAGDLPGLAALRVELRDMMENSQFCDAQLFAHHIEKAYKEMWRRYKAGESAARLEV